MATSTANGASRRANGKRHFSKAGGFSLLELSIVIVIIALVAGVSIDMGLYTIEVVKEVANNHKLNVIEQALMSYRLTNERLPCPTDASLATTSAYYGYEAGTLSGTQWMPDAGSCITKGTYSNGALTGTTTGSVAANYTFTLPKPPTSTLIAGGTTVAEGAVPFKALHLPESFMYDAWDRKFAYAVWTPMTATATSATSPGGAAVYGMSPSCGAITVNDSSGNHRSTAADYALVSFGPNGHGAYTKSGSRYFSGSDNGNGGAAPQPPAGAGEWTDCHCNATGDTGYLATYVQKRWTEDPGDSKDTFDDTVRFKERWQMTDRHDFFVPKENPCYPGFAVNGNYSTNGSNAGMALAIGDVNGDGIPDLIIGASAANTSAGAIYVVFGTATSQGFPDPLPLSSCNGTNCAEFDDQFASQHAGWSVAVGDVNGDGIADIIIGADVNYDTGVGRLIVVFGHTGTWNSMPQTLNSTFLNGTNGFELDGPANRYSFASSTAVGDVNGDGFADVIVGAPTAGNGIAAGLVDFASINPSDGYYVKLNGVTWTFKTACDAGGCLAHDETQIQGSPVATATQWASDLANCTAANSCPNNASLTVATYQVSIGYSPGRINMTYNIPGSVGNSYTVDTSGFPGAWGSMSGGYGSGSAAYQGAIYVVYGGRTGAGNSAGTAWTSCHPCTLNSTFLNGVNGVEFDGQTTNQGIGSGLAAGDVNGDGVADIAIGTGLTNTLGCCTNDQAFLVFGKHTTLLPKTTVTTANGSTCATAGSDFGLMGGQTVSSASFPAAGLVISAIGGSCGPSAGYSCSGSTCLTLSGSASSGDGVTPTTMYVSAQPVNSTYFNGTNGAEFDTGTWDSGARAVAIGDVNGDGTGDLVVGSQRMGAGYYDAGATFVIFGKSSGWPTSAQTLNTSFVNGINAVEYTGGSQYNNLGFTVNTGDVNGDKINDLILANGSNKLYTIFGSSALLPQTAITTTNGFATATVASYTGLMVGQTISASNLQAGTTILDCGGGTACTSTSITLSKSATSGDGSTPVPMYVSIQPINPTFLNGIYGVELDGIGNGTQWATTNVAAGDINGDGIADIIGANPTINTAGGPSYAGQLYVYFGKRYLWPTSPYTLTNLCSGC